MSIIRKPHGYTDGDRKRSFILFVTFSHAMFWKFGGPNRNNKFPEIIAKNLAWKFIF